MAGLAPAAIPVLLLTSFALAAVVSAAFVAVLAAYFALTTAYTLVLKRKMLVDTIVLATLYTIRVVAGAAAIGVAVSEWLLAFSMFFFTALALIKRYVELTRCFDAARPVLTNRNYKIGDLDIVAALAAAAGFNAITVFALYVSSDAVHKLYAHPERLWLVCPILMYWISRALMMAHRRLMDDDPIIFALRDRNSLAAAGLIGLVAIAATF
jgi:4-hydroxybenzoate polyprenyltransferase